MSERKSLHPSIVEIPEGSEDVFANLEKDQIERDIDRDGRPIEVKARDFG